MKTILGLIVSVFLACSSYGQQNKLMPLAPAGAMLVNPTVVQTGTHPTLTWNIAYPINISNVAAISGSGEIIMSKASYVSVSVVGTGVTTGGLQISPSEIYSEITVSLNGGGYQRFFFADGSKVTPQYSSYIKSLKPNDTLNFAARFANGASWSTAYSTSQSNNRFLVFSDGVVVPSFIKTIAPYTSPYVDASNKVSVGPMSALVMVELSSGVGDAANDYQDVVFLVNFGAKHPNNGHGNNLDGVDSSNPSNGKGGPNGAIDPSAGVDDEK